MVIVYEFGNSCFLVPTSEQSIIMVVESKAEFSSMDEFITAALTFLESDSEFCDNWTEQYKTRINLPASAEDVAYVIEKIKGVNQDVEMLFQSIKAAVNITLPRWNQITLCLETEHDYIFYSWVTSV